LPFTFYSVCIHSSGTTLAVPARVKPPMGVLDSSHIMEYNSLAEDFTNALCFAESCQESCQAGARPVHTQDDRRRSPRAMDICGSLISHEISHEVLTMIPRVTTAKKHGCEAIFKALAWHTPIVHIPAPSPLFPWPIHNHVHCARVVWYHRTRQTAFGAGITVFLSSPAARCILTHLSLTEK